MNFTTVRNVSPILSAITNNVAAKSPMPSIIGVSPVSTHAEADCIHSVNMMKPGSSFCPNEIASPSSADVIFRKLPPIPASICAAVSAAAGPISFNRSANAAASPAPSARAPAAVMPRIPNALFSFAIFCPVGMLSTAFPMSPMMSINGLALPAVSTKSKLKTPFIFSASAAVIVPSRLIAVPALLPCIPTLPSVPRIAAVSSSDMPNCLATGPA